MCVCVFSEVRCAMRNQSGPVGTNGMPRLTDSP